MPLQSVISSLWGLPEVKGLDLDSPESALTHRAIILGKPFLKRIYLDHYAVFKTHLDAVAKLPGRALELGSGGGFLKDVLPEVTTSDVVPLPLVDQVITGDRLPFEAGSLKAIFLLNVLHHIQNPAGFFEEAERCLVPGGRVVMIEPTNSLFARFLYKRFHHEPFDETAKTWELDPSGGRLTHSNQAMPWIIFSRDRRQFETRFPHLKILASWPHTVLSYFIISGGLSFRSLAPGFTYPFFRWIDQGLSLMASLFPTHQTTVLEKQS